MPHAKVTIYEAGSRVGGWLQSEYVEVEGGKVLLEKGPRTLRPNTDAALVTLDMVGFFLLLEKQILGIGDKANEE
jgi:protoporphyrinogen oxidase